MFDIRRDMHIDTHLVHVCALPCVLLTKGFSLPETVILWFYLYVSLIRNPEILEIKSKNNWIFILETKTSEFSRKIIRSCPQIFKSPSPPESGPLAQCPPFHHRPTGPPKRKWMQKSPVWCSNFSPKLSKKLTWSLWTILEFPSQIFSQIYFFLLRLLPRKKEIEYKRSHLNPVCAPCHPRKQERDRPVNMKSLHNWDAMVRQSLFIRLYFSVPGVWYKS